jgi:hypothetical protein
MIVVQVGRPAGLQQFCRRDQYAVRMSVRAAAAAWSAR